MGFLRAHFCTVSRERRTDDDQAVTHAATVLWPFEWVLEPREPDRAVAAP